jgi:hypothetical protein
MQERFKSTAARIAGRSPVQDVLTSRWRVASIAVACLALVWAALDIRIIGHVFGDATSYWLAWHGPLYEAAKPLWSPHFVYAPPAALAFWPLAQLPETAFLVVWTALGVAAYAWLLAPLPLAARLPAFCAGVLFSLNGNIEWVLALVAVAGLRWPALWLVALFTKVAPFMGFGWFVLRGEWRNVAWTAGLGLALVAISMLLLPGAWQTWAAMVRTFASQTEATQALNPLLPPIPFVVRALAAIALLVWGARKDRPVVLALVLALSQPDWQPWAFGFLAAVPRLMRPPEPIVAQAS